jgi:hypothetical protein
VRAAVVVVALLAWAAPAQAATYCVDTSASGCVAEPTVAAALDAAAGQPGTDTVRIGRRIESGDFSDANGEPVRIIGAGRDATVLAGLVDLDEGGSGIAGLTVRNPGVRALTVRGDGRDLLVDGDLRLRSGSHLLSSVVRGAVSTAGAVNVHSVLFAGAGIDVGSGELTARNVTLVGSGQTGVRVIGGASASLTDSIIAGFTNGFSGPVSATRSILPDTDPRLSLAFVPRAGSPALDAGDPDPLSASEPEEDAVGDVRAMDGDGDGVARRDIGAIERRPHSPPSTRGNLVANPGAERGTAATDDRASPAPPHWTRTGAFTSVHYGTVAGPFAFPSLAAAVAVRGGRAFFAAGPGGAATLRQEVDVSRWAPEIDARSGAVVSLSALLGGFRASEDHAIVTAHFRGPFNSSRGAMALGAVSAAQRGNATMLMTRTARGVLPRLTRSVVVSVRAGTPGGSYNDAYVDNVALVPRIAPLRGLRRPHLRARRQFAGAALLSPRVRVDRRRRARVRIGCPNATIGSCAGVVTLVRSHTVILGARRVALRPGQIRRLRIQLSRRERRALARRTPGFVYVAVRDRQGLTRTVTARVRILRR